MAEHSYHHQRARKKKAGWLWFFVSLLLIVLIVSGFVAWDLRKSQGQPQSGEALVSEFIIDEPPIQTVTEPNYSFELPADWVETYRFTEDGATGVTWESRSDKRQARQLTIYMDIIPQDMAVNKLLPVESVGQTLRHGPISENCVKYTPNADKKTEDADRTKPVLARWEEVDFLCDLPKLYDNVIGTGSSDGLNTVKIRGPEKGEHSYFFKYTDRSINPNNQIFLDAIKTFRAK